MIEKVENFGYKNIIKKFRKIENLKENNISSFKLTLKIKSKRFNNLEHNATFFFHLLNILHSISIIKNNILSII